MKKIFLLFFITLSIPLNVFGNSFELTSANLNEGAVHFLNFKNFLKQMETEVPILMKGAIRGPVEVKYLNGLFKDQIFYLVAKAFDEKTNISHSSEFQSISGWMKKGLLISRRVNLNEDYKRSPDALEFKNREESFAVNFKFFMTDRFYKCHKPVYYKYFSDNFSVAPFFNTICNINYEVNLKTEIGNPTSVVRVIDPSRIYQIHYLFASKGEAAMSRWGHAMYRIILCAPGKPVGPSCMDDYAYHVVATYQADVEDINISYLKGLSGSYSSKVYLNSMSEIIEKYTKEELRDVISLPLKLTTKTEIEVFINKLLENYWSYSGHYYFLTNNCATEAMNLLRVVFLKDKILQEDTVVSPLGLYEYLEENNLMDASFLNNRDEAIKGGYLFVGAAEKLKKSLQNIGVKESDFSFEEFVWGLAPDEREEVYKNSLAKKLTTKASRLSLLASMLRLEEHVLLLIKKNFSDKLQAILFDEDKMKTIEDSKLLEKIFKLRDLYKKLTRETFSRVSYGIPLKDEVAKPILETQKEISSEIEATIKEISDFGNKYLSQEKEEIESSQKIRVWILKEMKDTFK